MKIRSQFDPVECIPNYPGDKVIPVYEYKYDEKLNMHFKDETGKTDLDKLIQAGREGTDIAYILARYKAGDTDILNVRPGAYMDTTSLPKNVHELGDLSKRVRSSFEAFDPELKKLFGSFENFFNAVIDHSAESRIRSFFSSKAQEAVKVAAAKKAEPESEVKE